MAGCALMGAGWRQAQCPSAPHAAMQSLAGRSRSRQCGCAADQYGLYGVCGPGGARLVQLVQAAAERRRLRPSQNCSV
jgi:hypothetical protein